MTITTQYAALHVGLMDPLAPRFVDHPPIRSIEWACQRCGNSGPGLMPDEHASGACEATQPSRPVDWRDPVVLVRAPFHMMPDEAREAQRTVARVLGLGPQYDNGGGI